MVSKSEMMSLTADIVKTMIENKIINRSEDDNKNVEIAIETIYNKLVELNKKDIH